MQPESPPPLFCPRCLDKRPTMFTLMLPSVKPGFELKGPAVFVALWKHRPCGQLLYAPAKAVLTAVGRPTQERRAG